MRGWDQTHRSQREQLGKILLHFLLRARHSAHAFVATLSSIIFERIPCPASESFTRSWTETQWLHRLAMEERRGRSQEYSNLSVHVIRVYSSCHVPFCSHNRCEVFCWGNLQMFSNRWRGSPPELNDRSPTTFPHWNCQLFIITSRGNAFLSDGQEVEIFVKGITWLCQDESGEMKSWMQWKNSFLRLLSKQLLQYCIWVYQH